MDTATKVSLTFNNNSNNNHRYLLSIEYLSVTFPRSPASQWEKVGQRLGFPTATIFILNSKLRSLISLYFIPFKFKE